MEWSRYNYIFESKRNGYLLYNSQSNTFIKLNELNYHLLRSIESDSSQIDNISSELAEEFVARKILVKDRNQYLYERRLKYYFNAFDSANLGIALAPTSDCNFACPYCYEDGNKSSKYMTEQMENKVISFIQKHELVRTLNITWYGGEPLMGFETIKRLLTKIQKIDTLKLGLHNMPTNGYLLDEKKSLFFQQFPLTSIQITLDGNKEFHDKRRFLKSGEPTFEKILGNVDTFIKLNPNTEVYIRMNLDNDNVDSFFATYQELNERFSGSKVVIYPAFVRDYTDSCNSNCKILDRNDKAAFYAKLGEKYKGSVNYSPKASFGGCGTTRMNYYVIGPEGELYKCWNDLGDAKEIVGYIDKDNFTNYELLTKYIAGPTAMDDEECIKCKIFPICEGGCIWVRHKNMFEGKKYDYLCDVRKDNYEEIFELHYEQMINR
jgi:uncharacterized protein